MGIGYGVGIYDFQLIRTALKNLGIPEELQALFPDVAEIWLSQAIIWKQGMGLQENPALVLNLKSTQRLSNDEQVKIENWLKKRMQTKAIELVIEVTNNKSSTSNSKRNRNSTTSAK
ncbi:hypothetical protein DFR42_101526 [Undibacterium pigrum]|uniref:Uncharacterized protein n=2 Tax=Undibacterium pigrum TaxID=401470 RepID=A0A318JRH6_9BURK|nr:hypothetical protein DFR42_101526 [Undibacterium pigrum]